ncbi:unnamed protein product [Musa hybrid cultivar]
MMERRIVHRKCLKRSKTIVRKKKKPIKVVYISNPMRVTTSAATFRALVQKLTGRDSLVADTNTVSASLVHESTDEPPVASAAASESPSSMLSSLTVSCTVEAYNSLVAPTVVFDEENFCGLMSSTLYHERQLAGLGSYDEV